MKLLLATFLVFCGNSVWAEPAISLDKLDEEVYRPTSDGWQLRFGGGEGEEEG